MGIEIRTPLTEIEWNNYYDLRYRILREPLNQPLGSERNEGDNLGIHFGLYEKNVLYAIARLDRTEENNTFQVRFVAVESTKQGTGFGKKIMEATEQKAIELGGTKMILHARDYAVDFYTYLGYEIQEKSYLLFDVLQHYLMKKEL